MRSRYSRASAAVVTGGLRFGMTIARANCATLCGSTLFSASPSRRCRCQSSGRARVSVSIGRRVYNRRLFQVAHFQDGDMKSKIGKAGIDKVVLAYSGGLDTSVILKWLQDTYGCEVV